MGAAMMMSSIARAFLQLVVVARGQPGDGGTVATTSFEAWSANTTTTTYAPPDLCTNLTHPKAFALGFVNAVNTSSPDGVLCSRERAALEGFCNEEIRRLFLFFIIACELQYNHPALKL